MFGGSDFIDQLSKEREASMAGDVMTGVDEHSQNIDDYSSENVVGFGVRWRWLNLRLKQETQD